MPLLSPSDYAAALLIFVLNLVACLWIYGSGLFGAVAEAMFVTVIFYAWRLETALRHKKARRKE